MLENQSSRFHLPENEIYLNCAYMSPLLENVEKAGIQGIMAKRNPGAISPQDFFHESELLRKEFGELIDTDDYERIVTVPSVSFGMATVAKNIHLKRNDNIIVAGEQFPSNYYPWQKLCEEVHGQLRVVDAPKSTNERGKTWNERILDAIDGNTRVVALAHVHWADGTLFQLTEIRRRTREVGALLVIDGTQSLGALPFSIRTIQPDALICAGYKWLFGPYSIGLAYYGEYFDQGKPLEENWINRADSENFSGLVNYRDDYQPKALRYEVGEHSNFILVPMMREAIKQINQWGPDNIQAYCKEISQSALERLNDSAFTIEEVPGRGHHLFGLRGSDNVNISLLNQRFKESKIHVSIRGNAVRISPHLYNTADHLNQLVDQLLKTI